MCEMLYNNLVTEIFNYIFIISINKILITDRRVFVQYNYNWHKGTVLESWLCIVQVT